MSASLSNNADDALIVIAKAPVPGRVKTRLCPPCTPEQAAGLAEAALRDTLDAVRMTPAARRVLVLDGAARPWMRDGFEILKQTDGGLGDRLAGAFAGVGGPAFLVGMDTPQITPDLLREGLDALRVSAAVLGPAPDGGYWSIGLRTPDARVFEGVPMSVAHTLQAQRARLAALGLAVTELKSLRDVDDIDDVRAVSATAPLTRFARAASVMTLLGSDRALAGSAAR